MLLNEAQFSIREHNVEVVRKDKAGVMVRGKIPLEFRHDEVIGLNELPKNMIESLVPLDPPKTETERKAVARHTEREAAAKKKRDDK
ncbi:MAG: hypothetical protein AB7V13_23770 [Pseudorhodoplanes sp.]|uniref:hypothetical protein n=1 Tax=Pseudorhodoplanes sp. TaxID=1934341 RepID=UPI003D12A223